MRQLAFIAFAVVIVAASGGDARADDRPTFEVSGTAEGRGDEARTRALDQAFAEAIEEALVEVLGADTAAQKKAELQAKIVRRSRLYVASYKVFDERVVEGETRLQIRARVDIEKLRSALEDIGVWSADPEDEAPPDSAGPRPKVAVFLAMSTEAGSVTTFGSSGTDDIGAAKAAVRELHERGFELVSAAGTRVERVAVGDESDGLPLADASAADLARKLGAGAALIIGLVTSDDGRIRGTTFAGAAASGQARLLDVGSGRSLATEQISRGGWGSSPEVAFDRAAASAAMVLARGLADIAARQWPAVIATDERVAVRVRGAKKWASISAIIQQLAITRGVDAVHPREVRGDRVTLGLDTELPVTALIAAIRSSRLRVGSLSAKQEGDAINVVIRGD